MQEQDQQENRQDTEISPVKKVDDEVKKKPDEEEPTIIGTTPDLLNVPPAEEDKSFIHLKDDEGLLEDDGKADDGLI